MFLIFTENGKVLAKLCKHFSKGHYLGPENFSKELGLNFNLGPLKDLDGLIDEVLALDSAKSYLRKQVEIGRTTTGDLNAFSCIILEIQLEIGIKNCMV